MENKHNNKILEISNNAVPTGMSYNKRYKVLEKIDRETIFWYIIIFCTVLFVFSKLTIELNIAFGSLVGFILLIYLYNEQITSQKEYDDTIDKKRKMIIPYPNESLKYDKMVNFLFSVQDFYVYNPQAYEDMIEQIDYFFRLYEEVNNNNVIAGEYYELLNNCKRNALNSLQSIVHNISPNKELDDKLDNALKILNTLLEKYMNNVKKINEKYVYENGIKPNTKLIHTGPIPINMYDKSEFTYDMF